MAGVYTLLDDAPAKGGYTLLPDAPAPEQSISEKAWDVAKSIPTGIAKGATGLLGFPGNIQQLAVGGLNKLLTPAPTTQAIDYGAETTRRGKHGRYSRAIPLPDQSGTAGPDRKGRGRRDLPAADNPRQICFRHLGRRRRQRYRAGQGVALDAHCGRRWRGFRRGGRSIIRRQVVGTSSG